MRSQRSWVWVPIVLGMAWATDASAGTLSTAPNPRNFGNVRLTVTSNNTVVISNSGTATVITGFTENGGADCNQFTSSASGLPATLDNGDMLTVNVSFTPTTQGAKTCTVTINDDNGATDEFTLTGTGITSLMTVTPTTLPFGAVYLQTGAPQLGFTISNGAGANEDLVLTGIPITGGGAADYSFVTSPMPLTTPIAPGSSMSVTVTFNPSATGTRNATLTVNGNDPANPSDAVSATGSGINPVIRVNAPVFSGGVENGTTSTQDAIVQNVGTTQLTVTDGVINGVTPPGPSWFVFTNVPAGSPSCNNSTTCNFNDFNIAASNQTNVQIRCQPPVGAAGTQTATLTINSNTDTGVGEVESVGLSCQSRQPGLMVSTNTINFGSVLVGAPVMQMFTVTNNGTAGLTYRIIESGAHGGDYSTVPACPSATPCNLGAGNSTMHTVTFVPSAHGTRTASLLVESVDPDPPASQTIALSGTGLGAFVSPTTGSLPFGAVNVGASATLGFQITNMGNVDLDVTQANFTGTFFSLSAATPVPRTITPGNSFTFDVVCAPTARGLQNASLTFVNNSYNDTSVVVSLSCTGHDGDLRVGGMDPGTIAFGDRAEGSMTDLTAQLTNVGELPVVISAMPPLVPGNVGYTLIAPATFPITVMPNTGNSIPVTVRFSPTATEQGGPATLSINGDTDSIVVNISGNGQSTGIDVSTPTLAFGNVRWDDVANVTFDIENTAAAAFNVTSIMNSNMNDFEVTGINRGGPVSVPFQLTAGQVATVTVQVHPNNIMLGPLSGMLTITCNLPMDNVRVVQMTATSTSPMLLVEPGMTTDFGGVDIMGGLGATLTLRLRNMGGDGPMDVEGRSPSGAVTGLFSLPAHPAGQNVIDPGGSFDVQLGYMPTVEMTPPAGDSMIVTYQIDGLYNSGLPIEGPTAVAIQIIGHGTDRHIMPDGPVTFAPTYRNPGAAAPIENVDVMNTGEAPLVLSAVMSSGPPFMLLDTDPITVPGGMMATFRVQYAPSAIGMDSGMLTITHNDDDPAVDPPLAMIPLAGMGIGREMMLSPEIDVGVTAVGVPIRLDGALELVNQSAGSTFTVRELTVTDPSSGFSVDLADGRMVAPGAATSFGVGFAPTSPGPFETTIEVFLDEDTSAHGVPVPIRGHAVEVEIGGGCSAGGGNGLGALVVLGGLAAWRRRRRGTLAIAAALAATSGVVAPAIADEGTVSAQTFHPIPSIEDDLFRVESATVGEPSAWSIGAAVSYAVDPLTFTITDCGGPCPENVDVGDSESPVKTQTAFILGGAYAFAGRGEAGLAIPIINQTGEGVIFASSAVDGTTLGDIAAHAKLQIVRRGAIAFGAGAIFTVPTASDGQFAGVSGPSAHLQLLLSRRTRRLLASVNTGFLARSTSSLGSEMYALQQGNELTYGVGAGYRVATKTWIAGEVDGTFGLVPDSAPTVEVIAGLRQRIGDSISIGLGGGFGTGFGAASARGFLMLSYSSKMRPLEAMRAPPPPLDMRDNDGDGIRNVEDKCPDEAEDIDLFEDKDGCPDKDNDGDGIFDGPDQCDDEPEDIDGYQDGDGCIDPDNDGDGIPDTSDACRDDKEDKDGHSDIDGCPDLDNDKDGIPDTTDRCPNKPETINGVNDNDGCPDKGDSLVLLAADRIELLEGIKFQKKTGKLDRSSFNILGQVAATLRAAPEIIRIRVTAHVHPRDGRKKDQELSDQRAKAVRDWLVNWGITPTRLDARGFGSQKPLVRRQARAEEINDRIEFVIMEKQ